METVTRFLRAAGLFFALLFSVELIFGYSGTMFMVKGLAIRHILFILTAVTLYLYCFSYLYVNKIPLFRSKGAKKSVFSSFTLLDWAVLLFALSTAISFLVIPRLYGGNLTYAKSEILDALCMLLLYYPIRFMLSWGTLPRRDFSAFLSLLLFLLAAEHIVLYVGQTLNPSFLENYFDALVALSGNTAITPGIVLGHGGYPRIMYSTSLYLLVGFFFLLRRFSHWRWYHYLAMGVYTVALMTTMTKSLWYGVFCGAAMFTLWVICHSLKTKSLKPLGKWLATVLGCILLVTILNYTLFQGLVSARLENSFAYGELTAEEDTSEKGSYLDLDLEGAKVSNNIKMDQTRLLLADFKEHPLFGRGYGSYLPQYIRSEKAPFSYEMFLPAMLMKVGIVGVASLLLVVIAAVSMAIRYGRKKTPWLFAWFFLLFAMGLTIQTNPLLLSFNGISVILVLFWNCIMMKWEGNTR